MTKSIFNILLILLSVCKLSATPEFSLWTGNKCSQCHQNEAGGGAKTNFGYTYARDASFFTANDNKFLNNLNNQLFDDFLIYGFDFRYQSSRSHKAKDAVRRYFPMQASLYLTMNPAQNLSLQGQYNLGPIIFEGQKKWSFSAKYHPKEELPSLRVGFFQPSMGLKDPDMTALDRRVAGPDGTVNLIAPDFADFGAEIICQTARFWKSRVDYNPEKDRFEIKKVIGPDEYSESVDNNYFTNALAQWNLRKAIEICKFLRKEKKYHDFAAKIGLNDEELETWCEVADKISLPRIDELILLQFDGFLQQREIDLSSYQHDPNSFFNNFSWEEITSSQLLKQADVIMLLYLLNDQFTLEEKIANWDFYEPKTLHHSSLSPAIHSLVATEIGRTKEAFLYFIAATNIDLNDKMKNSDAGLHAATLGGIWQAVVKGFCGIKVKSDRLILRPSLPNHWKRVSFRFTYHLVPIKIQITKENIELQVLEDKFKPLTIQLFDKIVTLDQTTSGLTWPLPS